MSFFFCFIYFWTIVEMEQNVLELTFCFAVLVSYISSFKLKKKSKKKSIRPQYFPTTHNFKLVCFTNMLIRENKTKCFFRRKKKIYVSTKEESTLKINPIFKTLLSEWSVVSKLDWFARTDTMSFKVDLSLDIEKKYWEKETAGNSKSLYH